MKQKMGLLVMAYGTPNTEADLMPYYTSIRRGYAPTEDEVAVLKRRYEVIGGLSPLTAITKGQAELLVKQLNDASSTTEYELFIGYKHMNPSIEDAVTAMYEAHITKAVAIVMAPYFSIFATAAYFERARRRAARYGMIIREVTAWNEEPEFLAYWSRALQETLQTVKTAKVEVIFTAHSLPYHVIYMGDTYSQMVAKTAQCIAEQVGLTDYAMAWQSAGVRGDWLTPDVAEVTRQKAEDGTTIVYVPIGFVCDHLEILYDNDIACKALCDELKVVYRRVPMPNTDALFVKAMAQAVRRSLLHEEVKA